jgi:hypothetical protein
MAKHIEAHLADVAKGNTLSPGAAINMRKAGVTPPWVECLGAKARLSIIGKWKPITEEICSDNPIVTKGMLHRVELPRVQSKL